MMHRDYFEAGLLFKMKKVLRYVRLFGASRTLAKIRGQYHLRAVKGFEGPRWANPRCRKPDDSTRNVALIGCGAFAFANIAYYLKRWNGHFLRATFDVNRARAVSLCNAYGGAYATGDWRDILADPQVTTVYIASNHASHADYAVACIEAGKHVHIEKPHVVDWAQLGRLAAAIKANPRSKVFLGFNRPHSVLFKRLQQLLANETGPMMVNWFVAGHALPEDHWYLRDGEGGRVLGNVCHWTDLTLHLVSLEKSFPCTIVPATPRGAVSDCVVSMMFADGSCATITFSAKGHTFEGVREVLNVHKGRVIALLTDFQSLAADIEDRKLRVTLWHRDHGHEENLRRTQRCLEPGGPPGEDAEYVLFTAKFFLAVQQAVVTGKPVVVEGGAAATSAA